MQHLEPYYAVIFTSTLEEEDMADYQEMSIRMEELAKQQDGYLGFESARSNLGLSVSYWKTLKDIQRWKHQSEHLLAQQKGKQKWYKTYSVRICKVEREYHFGD
jgi:heme-degrading monooxygenase HmoA